MNPYEVSYSLLFISLMLFVSSVGLLIYKGVVKTSAESYS